MSAAIEATELVKTYPGEVRALDGLSLCVQAGTIFALLGPNGAGKSTTVKILTTLTPPGLGRGAGRRHRRAAPSPTRVRRAIGVVGAAARAWTPRQPAARTSRSQGSSTASAAASSRSGSPRCSSASASLTPPTRPARTYSGGMQRRLDVAMGLVHRPQVLFLDEPTTGLDPEARADMWQEIERLAAEEGITILLTTHYLEEADRLAAAPGDRRPRTDRRRGHARRSSRASCAATRSRSSSPSASTTAQMRRSRSRVSRACARSRSTARSLRARADDGAARGARRARRAGGRRASQVASVDPRAALARRRLPAPRRPLFRRQPIGRPRRRWRHDALARQLAGDPARHLRDLLASRRTSASRSCSRSSGCCCSARCSSGSSNPRLPRRLLHRLPHPRHRRDDRAVLLGRWSGMGLHRRHRTAGCSTASSSRPCGAGR